MIRFNHSISIVILCHNYGCYLKEAIESTLSQTILPDEVLVILDGCTDDSAAVAGAYLGHGVRIAEIFSRDVYLARRAGLLRTSGDLVVFLDADDILTPQFVEQMLPHFRDPAIGAVTPGVDHFGNIGGHWYPDPTQRDIIQGNCLCSMSMVRRQAYLTSGCFENLAYVGIHGQDYQTWLELHAAGWKFTKSVARVLYRRHDRNRTLTSPSRGFDIFRAAVPQQTRTQRRLRALFFTQTCNAGGVLENFLSRARYAEQIDWRAALIVEGGGSDDDTVDAVEEFLPVYGTRELSRSQPNCLNIKRFRTSLEALEKLRDEFDIIYCWGMRCGEILRKMRESGHHCPVLFGVHGTGPWTETCIAECVPQATRVICVCEDAVRMIPENWRNQVRVIHNGVDFSRLAVHRSRTEMRRHWGIHDLSTRTVGFVGRWSPEKNPLQLAAVVGALGPEFHAVYCSPQLKTPRSTSATDIHRAEQLTKGRVSFDYTTAVGDVYHALDCLLVPSLHEGGPLVAIEALAAGCPLVTTPVGMLPQLDRELATRGIEDGILFAPHQAEPDIWAERVREALSAEHQAKLPEVRTYLLETKSARRMVDGWEAELWHAYHQQAADRARMAEVRG